MRRIREVLRLASIENLSVRQIASCTGIVHSTVRGYLRRAAAAGLSWPLPEDVDDATIDAMLFPTMEQSTSERPIPEWAEIHRQLGRKGVKLTLLWREFKADHPEAHNYSQFAELYRQWRGGLDLVMRQTHKAGERLFVDYAGMTMPIIDADGEIHQAQIFVATFGASNYTFVEATRSQDLEDWIASHQRAFAFFGGVPELVVPDNLKSGVKSPHRYDPEINRTYTEMAEHYGVAVLPARVRKPRDKAKVESGVQVVEQWILAPLRDEQFFSLAELNAALKPLQQQMNDRPFQKLPGSRRSLFEEIDRPALRALPSSTYSIGYWKKVRVNIDYHIELAGHYYSVPYKYVGKEINARFSQTTVECYYNNRRIASHLRSHRMGQHTTQSEHMPKNHQEYAKWTPERIRQSATTFGESTAELTQRIISSRAHPEQGYRTCLGILRLGKVYGRERLEAAAERALGINALSYRSLESILKNGLDRQVLPTPESNEPSSATPVLEHENIRGSHYYTINASSTHPTEIPNHAE